MFEDGYVVLDRGGDWELRVDMDRKLVDTTLRPDMVLWSRQAKTISTELTVPWEEN